VIPTALFARYARALADVALQTGTETAISRDLDTYREIFLAVPEIVVALQNPGIPRPVKEGLLSALMIPYPVAEISGNFLRVLLDHNRFAYFCEICGEYRRVLDERRGVIPALATVVAPVAEPQRAILRKRISEALGQAINLEFRTDPELIGGAVLQIGSTVYDGSVRRQLAEVRQRLSSERGGGPA
jgi:F-type H+-transporting ATPase subunit delta